MELKYFVAETLKQIIEGVQIAQEYAEDKQGSIVGWQDIRFARENFQTVEFDVAVTTQDATQAKGGAGIFVGPVGVGSQVESDRLNQSVSRVKFSVPLFLPVQKKQG